MARQPQAELLWWEGCPSTEKARALLRAALDDAGLASVEIRLVEVQSDEQAAALGFRGSPTIRLDGVDLVALAGGEDPTADEPPSLTCRLYRRRNGRISPLPDPADVEAAIAAALARPDERAAA